MYGSVGSQRSSEGAEWGGSKHSGVPTAELHPRLRAPSQALAILWFVVIHAAVCGMLSFCAGHFIPWSLAMLALVTMLWPLELRARTYPTASWMMIMCVGAFCSGAVIGIENYHMFGADYLAGSLGRNYTDVPADVSALPYMDGGKIHFTQDAVLRTEFGAGLHLHGRRFCAAPVVSQAAVAAPSEELVEFWAVGIDCCKARGNFECGDSGDLNAHGGLVLHNDEDVPFSSFLPIANHHDEFMTAVQISANMHELQLAQTPVLVRWTYDPDGMLESLRLKAISVFGTSILVFLGIASFLWHEIHIHHDLKIRKAVTAIKNFNQPTPLGHWGYGRNQAPALNSTDSLAASYMQGDDADDRRSSSGVPLWGAGAKGFGDGGPTPAAAQAQAASSAARPGDDSPGKKAKAKDPFLVSA